MSTRTRWRALSSGLRAHGRAGGRARRRLALLAGLLLAAGCMEANPLPSPGTGFDTQNGGEPGGNGDQTDGRGDAGVDPGRYAYIEAGLTFVSSLPPAEAEGSVVVVGAPGATSGGAEVQVAVAAVGFTTTVPRAADGGFVIQLDYLQEGTEIVLTLLGADEGADTSGALEEIGHPLTLTVRRVTVESDAPAFFYDGADEDGERDPVPAGEGEPPPGSSDEAGVINEDAGYIVVTAPDEAGIVRLRSEPNGVTPYATVLVYNIDAGRSHSGQADNAGGLDMSFPAAVADDLYVFAAKPGQPTATTQAIILIVPRP